jgi:hypothetical protein
MSSSQSGIMHPSTSAFVESLASLLLEHEPNSVAFVAYEPGECLRKAVYESCDSETASTDFSTMSTVDTLSSEKVEASRRDFDVDDALPSLGSANHHLGFCSPCAYIHKGSCADGLDCKFCHLCPQGTIELRRKMKRQLVKAVKNANKRVGQLHRSS